MPPDPLSPALWACVAVGALAGLVRGYTGFGAALVLTPLLSVVVGTQEAAATTILLTGLTSLQQVPGARRTADWRTVVPLSIGALLTIPAGTWALAALDPATMRRAVAMVVIGFSLLLASGWRYRGPTPPAATVAVGMTSGVLTGAAGIGGPPVVIWTLAGTADAATARATFILFFGVTLVAAVPPLVWAGLATADTAWRCAAMAPAFMGATWAGGRLFRAAPDRLFRRAALGVLFLSGAAALLA